MLSQKPTVDWAVVLTRVTQLALTQLPSCFHISCSPFPTSSSSITSTKGRGMHLFISVYLRVLTLSSKKGVKASESILTKERYKLSSSKTVFNSALVQQINKQKKLATENSATNLGKVNNYNYPRRYKYYLHPCSLHWHWFYVTITLSAGNNVIIGTVGFK